MSTYYSTARADGWIPPLAGAIAAWHNLPAAAQSVRTINPAGAAVIFGVAWIAGYAGSVAALLVVAALLAGLYLARVATIPAPTIHSVPVEPIVAPTVRPIELLPAAPDFAGLVVREVKLGQANGKAPKVSAK